MKKIIAFGASNSTNSINRQFAKWTAEQLVEVEVNLLDLNEFEMPIFSPERQKEQGIHEHAVTFKNLIKEADGIIISFAEYNGSFSAAFKNIFDWMSRIERPIWADKPMFLMGTSPGGRGARMVLETAVKTFPHQGAQVVASFSLPSFHQNFNDEAGIKDDELRSTFFDQLDLFQESLNQELAPTE